MFNGMMDPELVKLAQEQMSRMSPAELARIQQQMMANPELMRMASESMKNMRPEDFKMAAEQLKHTDPNEMAEIGEKMANASPEEIASMRARADAQITYQLNAAQMLKKQGNELHSQGRFRDASEKYLHAKKNLEGMPSSKGRPVLLACSLNLMSCYLKLKQYVDCVKEGSEVLKYDVENVKALYRRGQAYKELGKLEEAVSDLRKAQEVSPDDETIADVLRDAEERLAKGGHQTRSGLVIEEITQEDEITSSATQPRENVADCNSESVVINEGRTKTPEHFQALRDDPVAIRSFQDFISNANPETLAAISGGKAADVSPEMFKAASDMISNMSPEELQNMLQMASTFEGDAGGSSDPRFNSFRPGLDPSNVTPDMLKTATDMMGKMSTGEIKKMFEMASSLGGKESVPTASVSNIQGRRSETGSKPAESQEDISVNTNDVVSGTTSSSNLFSRSRNAPQSSFPASSVDLQEQMRNQMKDPAMRQMFTSMMKNMSPEMMANMSEQFGLKLSRDDAARAQQAMSSLSPEDLDRMMRWADRFQKGAEGARKAKNWLLGRSGMILAICMLVLAVILHWLGYIGR